MSADAAVATALAACCLLLAMLQAADWPRWWQATALLALLGALGASGEWASHTSTAQLWRWAASPTRQQDLAALLLAEALLFGSHAVRAAQGTATGLWRVVGWLPAPSALLMLFLAEVLVMLSVDGLDYGTLVWWCAAVFVLLLATGTLVLRWALPDALPRQLLRVALHAVQAGLGLWLARPALAAASDPVPLWGERLGVTALVVAVCAALGWLLQRRR